MLRDVARVGGKNASLGELFRELKPKGVGVLDGFATTAEAYRRLLGTDASTISFDRSSTSITTTMHVAKAEADESSQSVPVSR